MCQLDVRYLNRRFVWLLLFVLLAACGLTANNEPENFESQNWRVFRSTTFGYSLEYPASWQAREFLDGSKGQREVIATVIPPTAFTAAGTMKRIQIDNPAVEDVADWGEELIIRRFESIAFELHELETIELANGDRALSRTYFAGIDKPISSRFLEVYVARQNDGLILRFEVVDHKYDALEEVFQRMIESFTSYNPNKT